MAVTAGGGGKTGKRLSPKRPRYSWGGGGGGGGYAPAWGGWGGGWGGGGGGGGGGLGGGPAGPAPWTGSIGWGGVPWGTWEETPWANVPKKRGAEAQQWFNTMLPWMQQQVQQEQWTKSFDWRKAMDEWNQGSDIWARGFQEQQLGQQKQLEQEAQSMAAFGRRWKPQTRWM